jgi:hypothetical protein
LAANAIMTRLYYKQKFYKDEDNEFSEDVACEKDAIQQVISEFWTGDNSPNGLEAIVISSNKKDSFILEHFGKGVFEVYFLPFGLQFYYHKMSRIELIQDSIDAIFRDDLEWLETNLNRLRKDNREVRGRVRTQQFKFQVTRGRLWNQLFLTLLGGIPIGFTFIVASILMLFKMPHGSMLDLAIPFLFFLGAYLWIPGIILHKRYKKDNGNFSLILSKGDDRIIVECKGVSNTYFKQEIQTITMVQNPWYKLPWSDYGYTEIKFSSGHTINLTNLLIDQFLIYEKFGYRAIEKKHSIYPSLRTESTVNSTVATQTITHGGLG